MLEFILLFFPAFISLNIVDKENKLDYKSFALKYPLYTIFINFVAFATLYLFKGRTVVTFDSLINISFALKYLLLTTIIAIISPYVAKFIGKNLKVDIEYKKVENANKKNRK